MSKETPLDRLLSQRLAVDGESLPDDDAARQQLPTLWSFLTRRSVDDSRTKEPAAISIRLGLGAWLVTLTDQSLEVSMTTTSPTLSECIEQLERACCDPYAPWSPWRRSKGKFDKVNTRSPGHDDARNHS